MFGHINVFNLIGGIDYFPGPFRVTFPAGATNASFPILIADDELAELTEYFAIYIKSESFHYLVKSHRYTWIQVDILDNDCKFLFLSSVIIIITIITIVPCTYA